MEKEQKIPKVILDLVCNDIESRIKIIKETDAFIQYKVMGYNDVHNIGMIDPNTKPQWFADFEMNQMAFNKEIKADVQSLKTDVKRLESKVQANTDLIRKYHPE